MGWRGARRDMWVGGWCEAKAYPFLKKRAGGARGEKKLAKSFTAKKDRGVS